MFDYLYDQPDIQHSLMSLLVLHDFGCSHIFCQFARDFVWGIIILILYVSVWDPLMYFADE